MSESKKVYCVGCAHLRRPFWDRFIRTGIYSYRCVARKDKAQPSHITGVTDTELDFCSAYNCHGTCGLYVSKKAVSHERHVNQ